MITIPATTSPWPLRSAAPRRGAGPSCTEATSATRIGVPFAVAPTATFSMSSIPPRYPRPRIMYSRPPISRTRAPMSMLWDPIASTTRVTGMSKARSRSGLTSTWYWRSKPPRLATSETPGTAVS